MPCVCCGVCVCGGWQPACVQHALQLAQQRLGLLPTGQHALGGQVTRFGQLYGLLHGLCLSYTRKCERSAGVKVRWMFGRQGVALYHALGGHALYLLECVLYWEFVVETVVQCCRQLLQTQLPCVAALQCWQE